MNSRFKVLSATGVRGYITRIARNDDQSKALREELIEASKRNSDFLSHIRSHIGFDTKDYSISIPASMRLNEQEFRSATEESEVQVANLVKECTPLIATSAEYWGGLTAILIEAGVLESYYLASQPNDARNPRNTGKYRIDAALKAKKPSEKLDKQNELSRFILRSFFGHPSLRGTGLRDFFQFCPTSRAWWRNRLAMVSSNETGIDKSTIHGTLMERGVWNNLSERGVSKLTVISNVSIFSGLVHYLVENGGITERKCRRVTSFIGAQSTWRELGLLKPVEISNLITDQGAVE